MIISLLLLFALFSMFVAFILLVFSVVLLLKSKRTNKKRYKVLAVLTGCYIFVVSAIMALQSQMVIDKDYIAFFQGQQYSETQTTAPVLKDLTKLHYVGMVEDQNVPWLTRKIYKFIFPQLVYAEPGDAEKKVLWISSGLLNYQGGMMCYNDRNARVDEFQQIDE